MLKYITKSINYQQFVILVFPPKTKTTTIVSSLITLAHDLDLDTKPPGHPLSEQSLLEMTFKGKATATRYGLAPYFVSASSINVSSPNSPNNLFKLISDNVHNTSNKFNLVDIPANSPANRFKSVYITIFKSRDLTTYERLTRLFLNSHFIPNYETQYSRLMSLLRTILAAKPVEPEPVL